jgi:hypothetical protein
MPLGERWQMQLLIVGKHRFGNVEPENIDTTAMATSMAARGKKPACEATTGRARIPAPTIVDAKRKMALVVDI